MKKTINILIIVFLIPIFGVSQMRERLNSTDIERHKLTGKVKQVTHKEYKPRFSTDTTYTLKLFDFLVPNNYKLEFNRYGNLTTRTELREENDPLKAGAVWKYKYDSNNRILEEKRISFQYAKDTTIRKYEYLGDSIINVKQFDRMYNLLYYTYKQNGNMEYLNQANSDSSFITRKRFVYDKQSRLTRYEDYTNKDYIQDLRVFTYSDNVSKNKCTEVMIWAKYNSSFYHEYKYDENGNAVEMKIAGFKGAEPSLNRYTYVYDKKGNWIEKIHVNRKGELWRVFRREIEYYE